jgi:membrane protease YdiL (CAAX protease family)
VALWAVAAGTALLMMRPLLARTFGWTVETVVIVFIAVLGLGLLPPAPQSAPKPVFRWPIASVMAAGAVVFLAGRLLSGGRAPYPFGVELVALNTLAAVAEEALFRRVAFAALLPLGPSVAVIVPAVLFGLAHATVYGWWAVPLDIAAGCVFGWQRWASGGWAAPAITHAFADFLVVI